MQAQWEFVKSFWDNIEFDNIETSAQLSEKISLEALAKFSPKNFCVINLIYFDCDSVITSKELEDFFKNWNSRIPKKFLFLTCHGSGRLDINQNNSKIINKYVELGDVKYKHF